MLPEKYLIYKTRAFLAPQYLKSKLAMQFGCHWSFVSEY